MNRKSVSAFTTLRSGIFEGQFEVLKGSDRIQALAGELGSLSCEEIRTTHENVAGTVIALAEIEAQKLLKQLESLKKTVADIRGFFDTNPLD